MRDETLDAIGIEPRSSNALIVGLVLSTFVCGTLAGLFFSTQPKVKALLQQNPTAEVRAIDVPSKRKSTARSEEKAKSIAFDTKAVELESKAGVAKASKSKQISKIRKPTARPSKSRRNSALAEQSSKKNVVASLTKSGSTAKQAKFFSGLATTSLAAKAKPPEILKPKPAGLSGAASPDLKRSLEATPSTVSKPNLSAYVEIKPSTDDLQPGTVIKSRKQYVIDDSIEEIASR